METKEENEDQITESSTEASIEGKTDSRKVLAETAPEPCVHQNRCGVAGDQFVFWQSADGRCHYTPIRDLPAEGEICTEAVPTSRLWGDLTPVSSRSTRSADRKLAKISTKHGMSTKILQTQPLLTVGSDGTIQKIRPGEIIEGETLIPRAQPNIPHGIGPYTLDLKTPTGRGKQFEILLDRGAGFLFGVYVAEGSACGTGFKSVSFAAGEAEMRKQIVSGLERWGLKTWANGDYVSTTSAALGRRLAETCEKGAGNKRIPDFLWTAPKCFQDGFVSGYFSGDGTVNGGEITASTVSTEMAEGVVFLLGSMGVRASYRVYGQDENQDQHLIKVYQEGIENFPVLALTRKQKRAQKVKASETKTSQDRIPVPDGLKTEVVRAMRDNGLSHSIYEKGYATRPRLKQVYGDLPEQMQALIQAPIWWELVDSVEEIGSTQRVCDLEMEQRSNFMLSGGLLVHDAS